MMKNIYWVAGMVAVMAGWASARSTLEEYSIVLEPPNGYRIPKIMGASGDLALETGYDYFNWYGVTEHRTWFKPSFSSLPDDSRITSAAAFDAAMEAIRKNPMRQGTSSDIFIDWAHFYEQRDKAMMAEVMKHLAERFLFIRRSTWTTIWR